MPSYLITVTQVSEYLSDADDRDCPPTGEYIYVADTSDQALDNFHAEIPIGCLEDFEIDIDEIMYNQSRIMHPSPAEIEDRFADVTNLTTIEGVAIMAWVLDDGSVFEERVNRGDTTVLSRQHFDKDSTAAWCYRALALESQNENIAPLPCWTVIGYYPDNDQRFSTVVQAATADEAEQIVLTTRRESPVAVCGVLSGDLKLADTAGEVAYQDDSSCEDQSESAV